ncbi:RNA pseudouridine synthase 6, chloroplastic [Capsicum annuum]|nr:RNA pseudouridine synthase 6, chloroplastic [Capsicum annuum]KAF3618300.1 RNA pseudouridine synthase 6, chloroplastic [Capsicum annuum]
MMKLKVKQQGGGIEGQVTRPRIGTSLDTPTRYSPSPSLEDFVKGWLLCQLEVLECKRIPWPRSEIQSRYNLADCGWALKDFAYECQINLLTGRTHQIRAQLAACSAPLVGDSMYMPAAIAEMVSPGSNPFGKNKKLCTNENDRSLTIDEWIAQHGKEPSVAVGLQACQISWDDGKHCYGARSPWWSNCLCWDHVMSFKDKAHTDLPCVVVDWWVKYQNVEEEFTDTFQSFEGTPYLILLAEF